MHRWGKPVFVTEFGTTHADGGQDQKVHLSKTRAWLRWMDENKISGAN